MLVSEYLRCLANLNSGIGRIFGRLGSEVLQKHFETLAARASNMSERRAKWEFQISLLYVSTEEPGQEYQPDEGHLWE
jgi:hypothetical protein